MLRREVLAAGVAAAAAAMQVGADAEPRNALNPEAGVTAPEDLMKEHGVLNRCLLIYEEGLRRLHGGEVWPGVFHHTALLVRSFVEQYHERNEERSASTTCGCLPQRDDAAYARRTGPALPMAGTR